MVAFSRPSAELRQEARDREPDHDERPDEQAAVADDGLLGGLERRLTPLVGDLEVAPEEHHHGHQEDAEDEQR